VLVVDDDRDLREMVAIALHLHGWKVDTAPGGRAALELLRAGMRPDVLLLDMMMPDLDGAEFVALVRADPKLSSLPIVVLTGDPQAPVRLESLRIEGYLRKPVELATLVAAVARVAGISPRASSSS
jgi:two-component system response regulator MprA